MATLRDSTASMAEVHFDISTSPLQPVYRIRRRPLAKDPPAADLYAVLSISDADPPLRSWLAWQAPAS